MKTLRLFLVVGFALAFFQASGFAATFQVFADTSSTIPAKGTATITKTAGSATTLPVSAKSDAYIYFSVVGSVDQPAAASVTGARLTFFVQSVTKAGDISLSVAGTNGDPKNNGSNLETVVPFVTGAKTYPAPPTGTVINGPIAVSAASAKNFIVVDVTSQVQAWLNGTVPEFGFAISSDGTASVLIGSKEGTGNGYPPVLEVDVNDNASGAVAGTSASFSGDVSGSNATFSGSGVFGISDNAVLGIDEDNIATGQGTIRGLRLGFLKKFGAGPVLASASGNPIVFSQSDQTDLVENIGTSSVTERMRIDSNGNVGIGTMAPMHKLDVNGNLFMGTQANGQVFTELADTIYLGSSRKYLSNTLGAKVNNNTDWVNLMCHPLSGGIIFGVSGPSDTDPHSAPNPLMVIQSGGNVGIGTTTPTDAKLVVNGTATGTGNYTAGTDYKSTGTSTLGSIGKFPTSILASNTIVASDYYAASDARIKNILGRSESATDLQTLRNIEVTDYHFKDLIGKGSRAQKKVVAQQVEKVYPQAVSLHTDVVPDIYQKATIENGWVQLATDLQVGDRVRLIGEKVEGIYEVLEVSEASFRTAFQPATDKVFVFGREVKDFRAVDYEAIAMLNVSATQEVARKLEAQREELDQLRAEKAGMTKELSALEDRAKAGDARLAVLEARDQDRAARDAELTARLARLESALDAVPVRTVRASLDLR